MAISFNDAQPQQSSEFEVIPDGTIAPVRLTVRGEKTTKANDARMLDCEFIITAGPYAKRKVWVNMMITSNGSDGHDKAVSITMSRVRAMLESAYGIGEDDKSPDAMQGRTINDWVDLDGLEFLAKLGIEKSKDPKYPNDKNTVTAVGVKHAEYAHFKPAKPKAGKAPVSTAGAVPASNGSRPSWA
jgi:hypothetical protein